MKCLLAFLICAACACAYTEATFFGNTNSQPRICVIRARNCNSRVAVCGRFGGSNLCQRFRNNCALQIANCNQSASYTPVNISNCRGIAVNQRGTCNGLSSSTNSNPLNNLLGSPNLLGSNTNGNVTPIIIQRG